MSTYTSDIDAVASLANSQEGRWGAISPEYAARMKGPSTMPTVPSTPSPWVAGTVLSASKK
jgi:hypothetical protein